MRALGLAAVALLLAQGAQAQDVLRGSVIEQGPKVFNWSGYYAGGQLSYVQGNSDFNGVTAPLVADLLRWTRIEDEMQVSSWPVITRSDGARTAGYGAYFGFNSQWDDLILGFDVSYMRVNYKNTASGSMERVGTLSNDFQYDVTSSALSQIEVKDVVTTRARAGFVMDQFLPYVTAGLAFARASRSSSVTVSYPTPIYNGTQVPAPTGPGASSGTNTEARNNILAYGFALGAGLDMMLMPNVIARAEYEWISLRNISTGLSTGRVGLAVKF